MPTDLFGLGLTNAGLNGVATLVVSDEIMKTLKEKANRDSKGVVGRTYPGIKAVYVNSSKGVVAVKFMDDEVRTATCDKEDNFDVNVGVAICIASYLYGGKKNFHKIVSKRTK